MSRTILLGLILTSVTLNASAQIMLRWGARQGFGASDPLGSGSLAVMIRHPAILGGLACYGFSLLVWLRVLSRADASFAYPFLAFGFALVALAGWWGSDRMAMTASRRVFRRPPLPGNRGRHDAAGITGIRP